MNTTATTVVTNGMNLLNGGGNDGGESRRWSAHADMRSREQADNNPTDDPREIPENRGDPEPKAMPRHSGRATRNTTVPAGPSYFREFLSVGSRAPGPGFAMGMGLDDGLGP